MIVAWVAAQVCAIVAVLCVSALVRARRTVRELRESLPAQVAAASDAVRKQEQERHARILHDRVLQIMESLSRGDRRIDTGIRGHIAEEAAWLRNLVETGRERPPGDLVAELEGLARGFALRGLGVGVNTASLAASGDAHSRLAPAQVTALVDATREALTNILKHSGVDVATVRASFHDGTVALTIVDAGRGFDGEPETGTGLQRSIIARISSAGGAVLVESAAGEGTTVELRMPLPPAT